ncbi:MFS transporter [Agaricicola taiwanensis]|uniref:MFS transporter n=1 Tax=Agaricicola taiwanensis TaxID=591372 RepID=A0A8J2YIZ0_9RHOB|nr:tripartite tricarboxylate transporter substrate binding protein [Agaricicola taiwanensis]GGE45601.1 MFS transporter [Agaricicola taiwanensis]
MRRIASIIAALAVMLGSQSVYAQTYPSKAITMVIPLSAGGSNDILGRYLADGLSKAFGQPVVVENRPGAGSALGSAHVAKSNPDGYTIMFVSSTYATNAATQSGLPFDAEKDLRPVALAAASQFVLVAGPSVKAKDFKEFLEEAKSRELFYASTGVGSSTQFAAELFNDRAGLKMTPVHYKGGTEALVDLIGGRANVYFGTVTQVLPYISAGQVRPLAITSKTRNEALPDVPTVGEMGITGAETNIWWGVFVPSKTPEDAVVKLNAEINKFLSTDESKAFLAKLGAEFIPGGADDFQTRVHTELNTWRKLAKERGITAK